MATTTEDKADTLVLQVLSGLTEEERLVLLPQVIHKLQKHLELYGNQGEIVSAIPLEKEYVQHIEEMLEKKLKEKVLLKNTVDKKILGGIIIRFRDLVIDQSLKRQLENIQKKVYEI